ncbi:MAG: 2-oxo acid dehydrogenase subunit E2, partial [Bacteroidota bacterium]
LSFDHRIVDGYLAGSFLRQVADTMEQFDIKRKI